MSHDPSCIFCKIVAGQIPSRKAYEDEDVLAFHDIHPWAPVHVLIIPKRHIASMADVTEAEAARIIVDQENRQKMMSELQDAFGVVVDAAVAGDFTKQVTVEFPDPELNGLASGVNNLVSTFNRGVAEMGEVLGAMANT